MPGHPSERDTLSAGTVDDGGWPLVAWAHGTLGVSDTCAPSWTGHKPRDATYIQRWLENAFAVVATDHHGLGGPGQHPYLVWQADGRSALDAVRAALSAYPDTIALAAATRRWEAVDAVRKQLPAGATAKLSQRFLTRERIAGLRLRPNHACRLKDF
ncbi:lipase family protein [Bradyrhizobium sp. cir1]|uniref:lipase family protein n=1 Tax=Bradyrhizobium sp. cir1 TaxID=1445730 RepID=UPI001FED7133|nr:lipase family protein [Bradyrhizobium sp. cir1]